MIKRYYTHLFLIFLVHALTLIGTWKISQSEFVQNTVSTGFTPGIVKLKLASTVIMAQPKVEVPKPKNPNLAAPKKDEVQVVKEEVASEDTQLGSTIGSASSVNTNIVDMYKAELRAKIDQNKFYPPLSRRLGQAGTVVIAFTLEENGNIVDVKIDTPSQFERLNLSALEAVKKVERFKPIPREFGKSSMDIKVPVKFVTFKS